MDAVLAILATGAGLIVLLTRHVWGIAPLVLGLGYGFFLGGRAVRWSRIRHNAGL